VKNSPVGSKTIFAAVLVITFVIPIYVSAETPFYITYKPGMYSPQSSGLDVGLGTELAFGYRFNPNIAAEFGFGYFNTQKEVRGKRATRVIQEDCDYYVVPLTLTLKAIFPYKKWEFFGLGGGGVYIVSGPYNLDDYGDYNDYDDFDPHVDAVWGGYLGGGIHYSLTPKLFLGAEGKYLWTDKVKLNGERSGVPLDAKFRLDGIIAAAVIGVRF
jgi:outer membrane protein W